MEIVGDAALVAQQIVDELERRGVHKTGYRTPETLAALAEPEQEIRDEGQDGAVDPRLAAIGLDKVLPADRVVICDIGTHVNFAAKYLSVRDPGSLVIPQDYASVGSGHGIALGYAVGRKERPTRWSGLFLFCALTGLTRGDRALVSDHVHAAPIGVRRVGGRERPALG